MKARLMASGLLRRCTISTSSRPSSWQTSSRRRRASRRATSRPCSTNWAAPWAVLDELGSAMKHFFELGQKVKLDGIGIFKVGFSSIGTTEKEDCGAQTITTRRVLFQPETERVVVGQKVNKQGKITQKYVIAKSLVKDVVFEETYDTSLQPESTPGGDNSGGNG